MLAAEPFRIKTIGEFHHLLGLPRPAHPLISVINLEKIKRPVRKLPVSQTLDFYTVSLKRHCNGNFKYGHHQYDVQRRCYVFSCTRGKYLVHL